jgi:hypothetical protein
MSPVMFCLDCPSDVLGAAHGAIPFPGSGAADYRLCAQSTRRFRDGKEDGISRYIGAAYTGKENSEINALGDNLAPDSAAACRQVAACEHQCRSSSLAVSMIATGAPG